MEDVKIMETFEPEGNLNQRFPDEIFAEKLFVLLHGEYLLVEVAIVRELHHYA